MNRALIIFIKNPELGRVKTRLASTLGNENALLVYKQLLNHTHQISLEVDAKKFLFYDTYIDRPDEWENEHFDKHLQQGNSLGDKMNHAISQTLLKFKDVVIIGSDCFELTASIIQEAFHFLKKNDVVIGPAADGGYYLLAMNALHSSLFENISWSTSQVLAQTIALCKKFNMTYSLLPTLSDVDVESDLNNEQKKILKIK